MRTKGIPKKDGSGKGRRVNKRRGGCKVWGLQSSEKGRMRAEEEMRDALTGVLLLDMWGVLP